ncbi:hypothetical protein PAA8504_02683 [Palleronia abyssalis]|uniref:Uncharacterized protein n=1 Tax=Palleronia abyssalis TaxID=1501240 RepID=A0A2R8BXJ0_9RHOB|nr:hypothetical protein PAA8504_02683 [Palleronia abyssalis]
MRPDFLEPRWRADQSSGPAYRIVWANRSIPVQSLTVNGLAIASDTTTSIPGVVRLYRGDEHVATGLIVSGVVEGDLHHFHFKRITLSGFAPPRDYAPDGVVPPADPLPARIRAGM